LFQVTNPGQGLLGERTKQMKKIPSVLKYIENKKFWNYSEQALRFVISDCKETIKLMPEYDQAIEKLKENLMKEKEKEKEPKLE